MASYTLRIENVTSYTPELTNIALTGCDWVYSQELTNGQPIRNNGVAQGTVEPKSGSDYNGTVTVHYHYVGRGPGGGDVTIEFGVTTLGTTPSPFLGVTSTNPDLGAAHDIVREHDDIIGNVSIT